MISISQNSTEIGAGNTKRNISLSENTFDDVSSFLGANIATITQTLAKSNNETCVSRVLIDKNNFTKA